MLAAKGAEALLLWHMLWTGREQGCRVWGSPEAGASQGLATVRCWCLLEAASPAGCVAGAGPLFKSAHDMLLIRMPGSTQLL